MKLIFGSGILLLLLLYGYANTESYFLPYPAIDTRFPPKFSQRKFERVTQGMTRAEVLELLGEPSEINSFSVSEFQSQIKSYGSPLTSSSNESRLPDSTWSYGTDGGCWNLCDSAWLKYEVNFNSEDKVRSKGMAVMHD
jgi:hypothetical protein